MSKIKEILEGEIKELEDDLHFEDTVIRRHMLDRVKVVQRLAGVREILRTVK